MIFAVSTFLGGVEWGVGQWHVRWAVESDLYDDKHTSTVLNWCAVFCPLIKTLYLVLKTHFVILPFVVSSLHYKFLVFAQKTA